MKTSFKITFIIVLTALVNNIVIAQTYELKGRVYLHLFRSERRPIANFEIRAGGETAHTDENGRFHLTNINEQFVLLTATKNGYSSSIKRVDALNSDSLTLDTSYLTSRPDTTDCKTKKAVFENDTTKIEFTTYDFGFNKPFYTQVKIHNKTNQFLIFPRLQVMPAAGFGWHKNVIAILTSQGKMLYPGGVHGDGPIWHQLIKPKESFSYFFNLFRSSTIPYEFEKHEKYTIHFKFKENGSSYISLLDDVTDDIKKDFVFFIGEIGLPIEIQR